MQKGWALRGLLCHHNKIVAWQCLLVNCEPIKIIEEAPDQKKYILSAIAETALATAVL